MNKIKKIPETEDAFQLHFMCPACKEMHAVNQTWEFNGDFESPSLNPSILVNGYTFDEERNSVPMRCHSWITKGKIKFFSDCSHEMAGQKWFDLLEIN